MIIYCIAVLKWEVFIAKLGIIFPNAILYYLSNCSLTKVKCLP